MGGTPEEILNSSEMMDAIVYPVVKADWGALDGYTTSEEEPLNVKITAVRGRDDSFASEEQQRAWGKHTKGFFELVTLNGGHFFLKSSETEVLQLLFDRLSGGLVG